MRENKYAIPTNIITGFLGVGKTTGIRSLLETKPQTEKWAVLVNEFGEVGLDASLLASQGEAQQENGVFIREVPGGCMCCASGVPMQVALNQLILHSNPDRLLIEPTGLGHPQEVLNALKHTSYQGVLDINATITLVDARKISDTRYTEHKTFKQQLQIADVIIANKTDLYDEQALSHLKQYLHQLKLDEVPIDTVIQGRIDPKWLSVSNSVVINEGHNHNHASHVSEFSVLAQGQVEFSKEGFIRKDNALDGYKSSGWIFEPRFIFNRTKLLVLFTGLSVERLKAIFITEQGVISFNQVDGILTYSDAVETVDSRIEVIGQCSSAWESLEVDIFNSLHKS
jgi:G3E family GTPase